MTPASEEPRHRFADGGLIVDHDDQTGCQGAQFLIRHGWLLGGAGAGQGQRHGEAGAAAGSRAERQRTAEKLRQPLHDRETEAKSFGPVAFGIAELVVFLEDTLLLLRRNAWPGIPDLDRELRTALAAQDGNATGLRMADGVRDQVAQDPLDQQRVRLDDGLAWPADKCEPLGLRFLLVIAAEPRDKRRDRKGPSMNFDDSGIQPRNIQQG